jgi:hypothetical protein
VETRQIKEFRLGEVTIRICPACGVVNPQGPSDGCPHLQLIRFDGVAESLETLLTEVAFLRRAYVEKVAALKKRVLDAVQTGEGVVETPHRISAHEVDALYSRAGRTTFSLSIPEQPKKKPEQPRAGRPKKSLPMKGIMDDRQLDLLLREGPKGDA